MIRQCSIIYCAIYLLVLASTIAGGLTEVSLSAEEAFDRYQKLDWVRKKFSRNAFISVYNKYDWAQTNQLNAMQNMVLTEALPHYKAMMTSEKRTFRNQVEEALSMKR